VEVEVLQVVVTVEMAVQVVALQTTVQILMVLVHQAKVTMVVLVTGELLRTPVVEVAVQEVKEVLSLVQVTNLVHQVA
jgi:hypothetical protein